MFAIRYNWQRHNICGLLSLLAAFEFKQRLLFPGKAELSALRTKYEFHILR